MRNTYRHSLNQPSLSLVALFGILSLCLFASHTPAQTLGEVKKQMQERGASPRTEAIPDTATTQQDDAAAQQEENLPEHAQEQAKLLVGAWLGTGSDSSKALFTFNSDGTLQANIQGQVSTTSPLGVFSDGHGAWRHLGGRQFGKVLFALRYDINTGQLKGYVKVRTHLTINRAGDKMTGTDKVEVFDADGNVVFATTDTGTFTRVKFEPFN